MWVIRYRERFGIGNITEDNYELAMCHFYYQMTMGSISDSYSRSDLYEGPMKVTVVDPFGTPDSLFAAVVPQEPRPVEKPAELSGWKRFWNRVGFYKKDMETYQENLKKYNEYVEDKRLYDENVRETHMEAERKNRELVGRENISVERKNQVHNAMSNPAMRRELHAASQGVMQSLPGRDDPSQLLEVQKYIPDCNPEKYELKPFLSGMGRIGSLATQLLVYTAVVSGRTLDEVANSPRGIKEEAGKQFKNLFLKEKSEAAENEAKPLEVQKNEAAAALAQIFLHCGKEQINAVDVLDPQSIRENAAHNIRLGLVGMDLGQMLQRKGTMADLVAQKMGGKEIFLNTKSALGAARAAGGPLDSLCAIYQSDEFLNGQVPVTVKRPRDAATLLVGGEKINSHIAGKPLKEL